MAWRLTPGSSCEKQADGEPGWIYRSCFMTKTSEGFNALRAQEIPTREKL